MDQLIKFTIRRPIATLMMLLAVVVFGLYTYRMMSVDLLPDIDLPIVAVGIVYAGAGPEDIENTVVRPVEDQFSGLEGLKHQTVTTMENVTFFMLEFATDRDIDMAAIDIKDKLDQIRDDLPDDIETPVVYKVDLGAMPIMQIALSVPEDVSLVELRRVAEDEIGPRLARTSGVATATISGGLEREIHVEVNPTELESRSLGLQTVYGLVAASNLNYPLGSIKGKKGETTVRLDGEFATLEEIENIEIPVAGGTIRLKDVARVVDSWEDPDQRTWLNGKQTVGFSISKRSDANTVKTAAAVRKELAKLNAEFPQGWSMDIVQDNSTYIEQAVNGVFSDMLTGILLTSVLLLLFLKNPMTTVIAAVSMPVSMVATFTAMFLSGFTLNMMSLMALGLSVGLLVTNVIVVLENIIKHLDAKGDDPAGAAERGTLEVALAVSASTLTNVAVFVPLAFMQSTMGAMFKQFGLTMVYATGFSLFVTFTLTPMMAAKMLRPKKRSELRDDEHDKGFLARLVRGYSALLRKVLTPVGLVGVVGITGALLVSMAVLFATLGFDMMPKTDNGMINVSIEMPVSYSMEGTDLTATALAKRIREEVKDVISVYVVSGSANAMQGGAYNSKLTVEIRKKNERETSMDAALAAIRRIAADFPNAKTTVSQASQSGGGGSTADILLQIVGNDNDDVVAYTEEALQVLRTIPGVASVTNSWVVGAPEFTLRPDLAVLSDYGLTVGTMAQLLRLYLSGTEASVLRQGETETDILVRFDEELRMSRERVLALPIPTPRGMVPISALVKAEDSFGPAKLMKFDKQHLVQLSLYLFPGHSMSEVQNEFAAKMANAPKHGDAWYRYGGNSESLAEGLADMLMAVIIAIILTYILLTGLLESFWQPLIIMMTIPLGAIGVAWALKLTGLTISMMALMAMVMLIGIVVNNAILILDYANWLRRNRQLGWRDAAHDGAVSKFRAVLMTNIASIAAMMPLAMAMSEGSEMRQPMAIASVGGLTVSTLMAVFLIPALYWAVPSVCGKFVGLFRRKKAVA